MTDFTFPALNMAGQARRIDAFGGIDLRVPAAATNGQMSIWESAAGPDMGPPMHVHTREDEMFYVLEGTFRFWCGEESFVGGPGTSMVLPRNVPHTYRNVGSADGRLLVAVIPGGFENFFIAVERSASKDPATLDAIAEKYGLSFVPALASPKPAAAPALSRDELAGISA